MTVQERLQLLNYGYTKEQVDAMAQPAQAPTVAQPAQAPAVAQPAPTQQAQPVAPAPVQLSPDQLTKLIQGVAVQTASGTIETPPTAEQALLNMFAGVAGEVNKNEQN